MRRGRNWPRPRGSTGARSKTPRWRRSSKALRSRSGSSSSHPSTSPTRTSIDLPDSRANSPDQQRGAQRQRSPADELRHASVTLGHVHWSADQVEQPAVLTGKVHWDNRCLGILDETGRKHFPRQIARPAKAFRRGGDAARGKDDDDDALFQQPHRLVAHRHVVLERILRLGEVYRQRIGLHLADLEQILVDHDAERALKLLGQRQYGDAVADTERMIGDDHQRRVGQSCRRPLAGGPHPDIDQLQHAAEHTLAGRHHVATPEIIERRIAVATGKAFDRMDEPARQCRLARIGIGKLGKRPFAQFQFEHDGSLQGRRDRDMKMAVDHSTAIALKIRSIQAARRLRSGVTASSDRSFTASARPSDSWSREPSRRMLTVSSSASRLPQTRMTGTLPRLCSRTL